ncbi:MAG TPA: YqgE/AlgH family protein [Candidatus Limnocylindrales bacterium]|nr:YqgE/AlgH family protein [Candidatus Limnocylindrales bacterium]
MQTAILCLLIGALWGSHNVRAAERENFFTGQLLVATAEIQDPRFAGSVIYMIKHDAESAMGLIINKPIAKVQIDDLLKSSGRKTQGLQKNIVIHYGGPVGQHQGFLLHTDDYSIDSTTKVSNGISMTADVKMLEALAGGKGPRQWLFMLGYAGWAPGQLEAEVKTNSWFILPGDKALIFGADADKKWRQAMDKRQIPL